ncbi:MAG: HypC/HybG/HupF family hydrogenase formation chaperone [Bacillota bacterium]
MCVAVPGRIVSLDGPRARVDLGGNVLDVDVSLIEKPEEGEWVVVHAGFALEKVDESAARETLRLVRDLATAGSGDES